VASTLWQQVADDLRRKIQDGTLKVGDRVCSTEQLAEEYAVSVYPVRQAINALKAEGLLEARSTTGVFVVATPEQLEEERQSVEVLAARVQKLEKFLADHLGYDLEAIEAIEAIEAMGAIDPQINGRRAGELLHASRDGN
jgi:DNA-binding GntR family transcriptional regulator